MIPLPLLLPLLGLILAPAAPRILAEPLVPNGGFEVADPADPNRPAGWDPPDGLGVQWAEAPDPVEHGRAIRMDTSVPEKAMEEQWRRKGLTNWHIPNAAGNAIADTYGLSYYSAPFPAVSGATYRVSFDFRGGSGAKLWVRGYGVVMGRHRRLYEIVVNCPNSPDRWTSRSEEFNPTRLRPETNELKVMLYAYHPPGVYWFDNIRVEQVQTNAPAAAQGP